MKKYILLITVATLIVLFSFNPLKASPMDIQKELIAFNHLPQEERIGNENSNSAFSATYRNEPFTCVQQTEHFPTETPKAQEAFNLFVDTVKSRSELDKEDYQYLRILLADAIKAKSWRAKYVQSVWNIKIDPYSKESKKELKTLVSMAQEGNPLALHAVLEWTGGIYEDSTTWRKDFIKAAVRRGNPQVMSTVGWDLATRTRSMRPVGIKILECAAAQGDADAYDGLGTVARQEGRWVDAYRFWQKGSHLGCKSCMDKMDDLALIQDDFTLSQGMFGKVPHIDALRKFYDAQFLDSAVFLPELRVSAPAAMWPEMSDEQLVRTIQKRIEIWGTP